MITADHIRRAFRALGLAGFTSPYQSKVDAADAYDLYSAALNLAGMAPDDLERAVVAHISRPPIEGQFARPWPSPGDLVAASPSRTAARHQRRELKAQAKARFDAVLRLACGSGRGAGGRNKPDEEFAAMLVAEGDLGGDTAALQAGVQAFGRWQSLCDIAAEQRGFAAHQFAEAYLAAVERSDIERNPRSLVDHAAAVPRLSGPTEAPAPAAVEPHPSDGDPSVIVYRWTHDDCRGGLCMTSEIGKVYAVRPRPRPTLASPPPTSQPVEPRRWSAAHVVAGLCSADDVGRAIPAAWRHPKATPRHSDAGEAAESILDGLRRQHGGS